MCVHMSAWTGSWVTIFERARSAKENELCGEGLFAGWVGGGYADSYEFVLARGF